MSMNLFRNTKVIQWVSSILLGLVLNFCINPPDIKSNLDMDYSLEENIHINEMESISEWILEYCFNQNNLIPEEADEDDAGSFFEKLYYSIALPSDVKYTTNTYFSITMPMYQSRGVHFFYPTPYLNILSPPPNQV